MPKTTSKTCHQLLCATSFDILFTSFHLLKSFSEPNCSTMPIEGLGVTFLSIIRLPQISEINLRVKVFPCPLLVTED